MLARSHKGATAVENDTEFPQKMKDRIAIEIQQPHIWIRIQNNSKVGSCRHIGTTNFIAATFTILKRYKQPKCPTDEWMVYTYNGILFSF